jgi:Mrp family chromosome partitioning ATPase
MLENIDLSSRGTIKEVESETETPPYLVVAGTQVTPLPPSLTTVPKETAGKKPQRPAPALRLSGSQALEARRLRMQYRQLCISMFLDERTAVRSLGFTSAIDGEGKSFLAVLAAEVMATDNNTPVTLLECNWEHPCFNDIFGLAQGPGLAEWLRGESDLEAIRQPVSSNLTVIRPGDGERDIVTLLQRFRRGGVLNVLDRPGEVLIVDLPSIVTAAYGPLAASLTEAIILVVYMGVTPDSSVAEASSRLKDLPVRGVILNQIKGHLPRWLGGIL